MKREKVILAVSVLAFGLALASPLWADTRTASVSVSCTILPMIELSSAPQILKSLSSPERPTLGLTGKNSDVRVNTNLGKKFGMDIQSRHAADGALIKVYSVTAL